MRLLSALKRPSPTYPAAPDGLTIYAIGDIHGRADLLLKVQEAIDADRARTRDGDWLEIYLGDFIDRGPGSAEVISLLEMRHLMHGGVVCLQGNHEIMLRHFLDDPERLNFWARAGGGETLASYGVRLSPRAMEAPEAVWQQFRNALPGSHLDFFTSLPSSFACGGYVFVHAGLRPGVPLAEQREEDLTGIRREFLDYGGDLGAVVVHGHTPVTQPQFRSNRIGIDTGAYASNRLTCLKIGPHGAGILPHD